MQLDFFTDTQSAVVAQTLAPAPTVACAPVHDDGRFSLRPYQSLCVLKIKQDFCNFDRLLLTLPTGGGKTRVFSQLAHDLLPQRTLILAHREELIDQAIEKLYTATGVIADKEMAAHEASESSPVVVASIQTMMRRKARWNPEHFSLVVADEAHHSVSASWRGVIDYFKTAKLLGVTATPDRTDNKNLGVLYEHVAHEVGLYELIHQGYLAPITVKSIPIKIDLNKVRITKGDYDANDLDSVLIPHMDEIAASIRQHAPTRKILVFLPLIATSKTFTAVLQRHGFNARHIDGQSEDRKQILADFRDNKFQILCNAMVLLEGYDEPSIDSILFLRPTKSRPMYAQAVGRGTRIHPGKQNLLLFDHLYTHERLRLCRPASLICHDAEEEQAITQLSFETGRGEKDLEQLQSTAREQREKALQKELERKARKKARVIDPNTFLQSIQLEGLQKEPEHFTPPSEQQLALLSKFKIDTANVKSDAQARHLVGQIMSRQKKGMATPNQVILLQRFKIKDANTWSYARANAFLTQKFNRK